MDAEHSLNKPRAKPIYRLLPGSTGGGKPRVSRASADAARPARAQTPNAGRPGAGEPGAGEPGVGKPGAVELTPQVLTAREQADISRRVCEAFRARIGQARYAVWFGDAAGVEVLPAENGITGVVITVGGDGAHEWLCKMFRKDFESAAGEVCGKAVRVLWQANAPGIGGAGPSRTETPEGAADNRASAGPAAASPKSGPPSSSQGIVAGIAEAQRVNGTRKTPPGGEDTPRVPAGLLGKRVAPRLDSFCVGPSNRMAFAAGELVANRPGEMSPLVLHGPSGVGKTHLLEGICSRSREVHPGMNTLFLSAEQFTTNFLDALHGRRGLPGFRRACRSAHLLVIDDLQFFVGKRATLVELQHTVDDLLRQGRQMVFACDRELESLEGLGAELLARLRGGMNARILPPDEEVRRGIVATCAERRGLVLPADVVDFVAAHITRHARELAGAVNRLEATSHMLGLPVSLGMAREALADLVRSSARSVRLADVERAVCSAFGIEAGSLQSACRARKVNHPRMLAMFLARKHTPSALAEIGTYFGRRSHSTVISAHKAVGEWVAQGTRIVLADATWDVQEAIRRVEEVLRAS